MREAVFRVAMAMLLLLMMMMVVNVAGRSRERRGASLPVGEMGPGGTMRVGVRVTWMRPYPLP